ncbi:MAG: efflux RND transporter periplasmic adaptor subunit [Calditrichia bacterium]
MKKKVLIISIIVIFLAVIIIANVTKKKGIKVTTTTIDRGNITEVVTGSGKIYPVLEVKISANVAGEIIELPVEEGDTVKKGQRLVKLDQERYLASLSQAESGLLSQKANLRIAKVEYERIKKLYEKKLVSEAEFERAQASLEQAESQYQQAEAFLKEAKDALSKTVINSPIEGVVIEKRKEKGEIALGSQFQADVILVIGDLTNIEARVEINENDIPRVEIGDTANIVIDAFPDSTFKGIVTKIAHSPIVSGLGSQDEVTNYLVYIKLLQIIPDFRTGMSCSADIATETHYNVVRVPIQAVTARTVKDTTSTLSKDETKEVVFLVDGTKAKQQVIELGISDDDYYEVLNGLKEGDVIITGPFQILSQRLKDGDLIQTDDNEKKGKK